MTPPKGWELQDTGGGCTSFERPVRENWPDDYWCITDEGDPSAPENPNDPVCLSLCSEGTTFLQWHCSCLAEALAIAEGAQSTQ